MRDNELKYTLWLLYVVHPSTPELETEVGDRSYLGTYLGTLCLRLNNQPVVTRIIPRSPRTTRPAENTTAIPTLKLPLYTPNRKMAPSKRKVDEEELIDEEPPSIEPYTVLGIEKTATPNEVKSAYRKAALKHHPGTLYQPISSVFSVESAFLFLLFSMLESRGVCYQNIYALHIIYRLVDRLLIPYLRSRQSSGEPQR